MTTLLIIESPGKKAKLSEILGPGYRIEASFGHVRDLPGQAKNTGVTVGVASDYSLEYEETEKGARTIKALKAAAKDATVLLATDPDREGEAIAWHLAEVLQLKNAQRVTYAEITKPAILAAVQSPRPINMHLVRAQEARRAADRLVGYLVSGALSEQAGNKLSAGRVQSPAVRIIVDRDRAITAFKSVEHYGAELMFDGWSALWNSGVPEGEYFTDKERAEVAAGIRDVIVTEFADSESRSSPPPAFTTSTLQQRAQVALKFKPKRTMELAQSLYEKGAITYMRTDTPNISETAFLAITAYCQGAGLPVRTERRVVKAKGNAQEAHEAIRPSHFDQSEAGETDDEKALYRMIFQRAVASQMPDAIFAVRTATLASTTSDHTYTGKGKTLVSPGWKQLNDEPDEDEKAEDETAVPDLAKNSTLVAQAGRVLTKHTKPPKRFTLATLIRELEKNGIGRPATYASILENIIAREYIAEDAKGWLMPCAAGFSIVDSIKGRFRFADLDYTSNLETQLDSIAEGQAEYAPIVKAVHDQLQGELTALKASAPVYDCPLCNAPLARRRSERGAFWGCTKYPDCKHSAPDDNGKPGVRSARPEKGFVSTPKERTYLDVTFEERLVAKAAGALYDGDKKKWFVETKDKEQLKPFKKWLVKSK